MRGVVQRVLSASVSLPETQTLVSSVGPGLCVLVGIDREDTMEDVKWLCNKLLSVRVWDNAETGKTWGKCVKDIDGEVLLVSQFTLCHVLKGNKPDFHNAMGPEPAAQMFDAFVELMRAQYKPDKVKTGAFGQYMKVDITNDGPVTLVLDSPSKQPKPSPSPSSPQQSPPQK